MTGIFRLWSWFTFAVFAQTVHARARRNTLSFRPVAEHLEERAVPATYIVTTNLDGNGVVAPVAGKAGTFTATTLRAAIRNVNAGDGGDTILFDIPKIATAPNAIQTIHLQRALPPIAQSVQILGYSEPGAHPNDSTTADDADLLIVLDGGGANFSGLRIIAGSSAVSGLVFNNFSGVGIQIEGKGGNVITGDFIGTDVTGVEADGVNSAGIRIDNSPDNRIGGAAPADRNLISGIVSIGSGSGIRIVGANSTGNQVWGNFIGVDRTGLVALPNNGSGVAIQNRASGNFIGGAAEGEGNVISGNRFAGVSIGVAVGLPPVNNSIVGNLIGTNSRGTAAVANTTGVVIDDAATNVIQGNTISGNDRNGIFITGTRSTANQIRGNYIGLASSGFFPIANGAEAEGIKDGNGVYILNAPQNVIGGADPGSGNTISGNDASGIRIEGSSAFGTQVLGNTIGLDPTQLLLAMGNGENGVTVDGAPETSIGDGRAATRNVIAGNGGSGVSITGNSSKTRVQGNYIGTDGRGSNLSPLVLGNRNDGVSVSGASNILVGGSGPGSRNVISGNLGSGVLIDNSTGIAVRGNFIGTDASGTARLGNGSDGILVSGGSTQITIGGLTTVPGQGVGNLISGNGRQTHPGTENGDNGIELQTAAEVRILGNLIGTDVTGKLALGNANDGIGAAASKDIQVGGNNVEAGNVISGNGAYGLDLFTIANPTEINNKISTDITGLNDLPNKAGKQRLAEVNQGAFQNNIYRGDGPGVQLVSGTGNRFEGNTFTGGTFGLEVDAGSNDVVASNTFTGIAGPGVSVLGGTGIDITKNSMFDNNLGIDLGGNGVTLNNSLGHHGPNDYQNFPVLTSATAFGPLTTVSGTLESTADTTFTVEFFASPTADPSGYGEGQTYLGSLHVTTDSLGNASFSKSFSTPVAVGSVIAATATDPNGNTSEFSGVQAVTPTLFDTGVNTAGNIVDGNPPDLHYTYQFIPTSSSALVPPPPVPPFTGASLPAVVATNAAYIPDGPVSRWITPYADTDQVEPIGFYVFTTHFTIPTGVDASHIVIAGQWSTDNQGYTVFVNGHYDNDVAITNLVQYKLGFVGFTLDQGFHTGDNTIQFVVFNSTDGAGAINPVALRVEFNSVYLKAVVPQTLGLFDSGVDATGQAIVGDGPDAHWTVTLPSGQAGTPYVAANAAYLADSGTSRWLTIDPNTNQNEPAGNYTWTTQFTIPAGIDPTKFVLYGRWSSDNEGASILVNGVATGVTNALPNAYTAWAPFRLIGPFQTGVNTLTFVVTNDPASGINPTALRVEFTAGTLNSAPTPASPPTTSAVPTTDSAEPDVLPVDTALLAAAFQGPIFDGDNNIPAEDLAAFFQMETDAEVPVDA